MKEIEFIKGDATQPIGQGVRIIAHICNDIGGWGKGFVLAISKRWAQPETEYRAWAQSGKDFELGEMQLVKCEASIFVANMVAQHKLGKSATGQPPIRYDAVRSCLASLKIQAVRMKATVHMPRIGSGLAGGDWAIIEEIIKEELLPYGVAVKVYDF